MNHKWEFTNHVKNVTFTFWHQRFAGVSGGGELWKARPHEGLLSYLHAGIFICL